MKTYTVCKAFILMTACLFLGGYTLSLATAADLRPRRTTAAGLITVQPARLVIWRLADLGQFISVDLSIDGVPVANIVYGETYQGFLAPGRHVLSVVSTPDPKYPAPWQMILDVRPGQIYAFTAISDSGKLILQPPGLPEIPRGR
jgi:hypothetical protein